ncbi:MAG: bifunctional [glutamine synthetase] adenylyltransferase/[glutamine synthetase]-adenylyl-L-tyrosine phosphorylase [Sporichthyaceae bacterium]
MTSPDAHPGARTAGVGAELARLGFTDVPAALQRIADSPLEIGEIPGLVAALGEAADPDQALDALDRLARAEEPAELRAALALNAGLRSRLIAVLGASVALGDHLVRHPDDWRLLEPEPAGPRGAAVLRTGLLTAVGADPYAPDPIADASDLEVYSDLRVQYRRSVLTLAARDLTGVADLEEVAAELADLAAGTLDAALAVARAALNDDDEPCRFAVIGMGKCGGRELNYVSDVDVVFVAEATEGGEEAAALKTATKLATTLMKVCGEATPEGAIWPVDPALRPEGKAGPLVRTVASHAAYYERWAQTWEFQALLKARPVAGDLGLGEKYMDAISPLVWKAAGRENFVHDVQAMRRRVESTLSAGAAERQLKLGPGGLRDVEFAVQLLELVHGRADESLRTGNTLGALAALARGGYVGRDDAAEFGDAYRFLRTLEHRIQMHRLRRTHVLPDAENELRRLGRSLGLRNNPAAELTDTWRRHTQQVRRLHEKLFYRPLLTAVARLAGPESRLTVEAARARLSALGYADPPGALRHLEALTAGLSRRASIQRTLLPVMLGWFADAADPDAGLLAFRQVSDALGATPWYLRLLRDEGQAAQRMATVLAGSRFVADLLSGAPEAVAILAADADLVPRSLEALANEAASATGRARSPEDAVLAVRGIRRRELFRIGAADVLGNLDVAVVADALSNVAAVTLRGGLDGAIRAVAEKQPVPVRFAIVAMGRLGGHELGYSSDADVVFVYDPEPDADEREATEAANAIANELRRLLHVSMSEPGLEVDADLRPEGRNGPLVRSIASYEQYYARWSSVWEAQALLRAEYIAGDTDVGERFTALVDPIRYPATGLTEDQVREIRRIKARVENERMPRGADPKLHTKLGRGGLADVEWVAQLLCLQHAAKIPELRTTRTLEALAAAEAAGLLARADAEVLTEAWRTATRVRNAIMLVRGRPSDSPPGDGRARQAIGRCLGYPPATASSFVEDYQRLTRHARSVVERVFYG